jgi:hypothetical protein
LLLQTLSFAWNHGDFQNDVTRTWLGIVGPGVCANGRCGEVLTDHSDIRPTILSLAHLKDDYAHDGRVVFGLSDQHETLSELADVGGVSLQADQRAARHARPQDADGDLHAGAQGQ